MEDGRVITPASVLRLLGYVILVAVCWEKPTLYRYVGGKEDHRGPSGQEFWGHSLSTTEDGGIWGFRRMEDASSSFSRGGPSLSPVGPQCLLGEILSSLFIAL